MRQINVLLIAGLFVIAGCGKSGVLDAGKPSPPAEIPASVTEKNAAEVAQELTMAMHRFKAEKGQFPNSLDELLAAKFIDRLPAAPAGKRFAINRVNFQVELVNQ
jgi:hypothetical protein